MEAMAAPLQVMLGKEVEELVETKMKIHQDAVPLLIRGSDYNKWEKF